MFLQLCNTMVNDGSELDLKGFWMQLLNFKHDTNLLVAPLKVHSYYLVSIIVTIHGLDATFRGKSWRRQWRRRQFSGELNLLA